ENGVMVSRVHGRNDIHTTFTPYKKNLPGVTEFDNRQIAIPVHWKVTKEQREKIAQLCNRFDPNKPISLQGIEIGSTKAYIKQVETLEEALVMRTIRNEGRKFMTHYTSEI